MNNIIKILFHSRKTLMKINLIDFKEGSLIVGLGCWVWASLFFAAFPFLTSVKGWECYTQELGSLWRMVCILA